MAASVLTFLIGAMCIFFGISHTRGNLSSLHSYHRDRVSPEDIIPFGKRVGLGTIICGVAIMIFGVLSAFTFYTENDLFILIGTGVLIVGLAVGLIICVLAMIKYNKGVF